MYRRWHVLNAALVVALLGFSLYAYPELPERFPSHFDIRGEPDGWSERTLLSWLTLPLIGLVTCAVLYAVAAFVPKRPRSVNLPDKKKLLELPADKQRWVLEGMSLSMYRTVSVMLVMFGVLQYGAYRAALLGSARTEILAGVLLAVVVVPVVSLSSLVLVQSRLTRAHRAWSTGRPLA